MITRHDAVKLKCDLLVNGLRLADLRRDLQLEQGWDATRAQNFLPAELQLPHEVYCQIREHHDANFRLRIVNGTLQIQDRLQTPVCSAAFVSLPPFSSASAED